LVKNADLRSLGNRIREARTLKGWSQEELAARAELDRSYVGGIERGERNITIRTLAEICRALGCQAHELVEGIPSQLQ